MKLITYPHDILREIAEPITEFGAGLKKQGDEMYDIMVSLKGAGLAANQVGLNKRLFVIIDGKEPHKIICNPHWTNANPYKKDVYVDLEGCLSFPDVFIPIVRYRQISLSWQDWEGKKHLEWINGYAARVVQHETEHLDGILFVDHNEWDAEGYEKSL